MRSKSFINSLFLQAPATLSLVGINALIFFFQRFLLGNGSQLMATWFGLSFPALWQGQVWRLVTHQFIHGNLVHLLFNMMALWFAGIAVESAVGTRRFLTLYFSAGIVGGLVQVATNSQPPFIDLIGASGAVCGILMAFCTLFPRMQITALIFFVIPLRLRARTLGIGIVVATILFWLSGWEKGIGHLAHLGGLGTGFLFGLWWMRSLQPVRNHAFPPPLPREPEAYVSQDPEMDRIFQKVSRQGFDSLTASERQCLEERRRQFLASHKKDFSS